MAKSKKIRINLSFRKAGFVSRIIHYKKFSPDIASFRKILTKEKADILQTIKTKNPGSIYKLAKILKRDFRQVHNDVWLLHNFGIIEFYKKQKSLQPYLASDKFQVNFEI